MSISVGAANGGRGRGSVVEMSTFKGGKVCFKVIIPESRLSGLCSLLVCDETRTGVVGGGSNDGRGSISCMVTVLSIAFVE